jgi:FSR family fosmidomycin resistance protein-like MFS transporter
MNVRRLSAVAFGHFSIDVLNSSIAVILTILSGKFDLSISQIGLAAMIYTFAASLTQPLFGILADYLQGRWLGAISVAWTGLFYGLAAFAPSYPLLVTCLTIGALGSGAFHPVGMVNAAAAGGPYPTTATSIFFLLGQTGLAIGPMVGGLLLQYVDITVGLPLLALSVLPAVAMMAFYLRQPLSIVTHAATPPPPIPGSRPSTAARRSTVIVITAFIAVVALRAATVQSLTTLLPKYFADLGYTSGTYGVMIGVFAFAGALGTFLGGYLGDRVNRRLTLFASTLLSVPFCFLLLRVDGWLFYLAAACAGALLNVPHSILIIMAQRLLPKREGMIGGAVLGFMFASGAALAWLASWFADQVGLLTVLSLLAFVPIGAAFSALLLPSTRQIEQPVPPTGAPAAAD